MYPYTYFYNTTLRTMSSRLLIDYRCTCGKLLFKGLLCQGFIEVKCRRCGVVSVWTPNSSTEWSLIESDEYGNIVMVSGATGEISTDQKTSLRDRRLAEALPMLRDAVALSRNEAYRITDTTLVMRDGSSQAIEACIMPHSQEGGFAGYRIYMLPK